MTLYNLICIDSATKYQPAYLLLIQLEVLRQCKYVQLVFVCLQITNARSLLLWWRTSVLLGTVFEQILLTMVS